MAYVGIEIIEPPPLPPPSQVVVAVRVDEAETQKEPPSRDGLELLLSPTATDEKVPALLVSNDVVNSSAEEDAAPSAEEEIGGGGARHGTTRWKVCILHFPCFFLVASIHFPQKYPVVVRIVLPHVALLGLVLVYLLAVSYYLNYIVYSGVVC
jgi:hypothetical protein